MDITNIKKILKDKKITYMRLSELSGVPLSTIKSVFCGKTKNPTIDTVNAIKRALGLDTDEQINGIAQNYITQEEEKIIKIYRALDEKRKNYFMTFAEGLKYQSSNKEIATPKGLAMTENK